MTKKWLFFWGVLMLTPITVSAQVASAQNGGKVSLAVGAGFSGFDTDYAPDYMYGVAAYADLNFMRWFGIEAEWRTIQFDAPGPLKENTIGGGGRFMLPTYGHFHPYAKFLLGTGRIDF